MKRKRIKRNQGSVAALAFVALVPLVGCIGGFAVDCMHVNDEKGACQRATDAAAIGGGLDLPNWKDGKANSNWQISAGNCLPVNSGLKIASMNAVDGDGLAQATSAPAPREITVSVRKGDGTTLDRTNPPNQCVVDAKVRVSSLLFSLMHNNFGGQTINTHSVAGSGPPANTLLTYFPLLLSYLEADSYGDPPLGATPAIGSTLTFNTRGGNAAWTAGGSGHGASDFQTIVDGILTNGTGSLPEDAVSSGATTFIKQGTMDSLEAATAALINAHLGETIVMPVTAQTDLYDLADKNVLVKGFIAIKLTSALHDTAVTPHTLKISGTVVGKFLGNGITRGTGVNDPNFTDILQVTLVE
jgi:hypothetical protein